MSTVKDYIYFEKEEFDEFSDQERWDFIESLKKAIEDLLIMAEKNCSSCAQYHLAPGDVNIAYLFEDWRNCAEECSKCSKEQQVNMCQIQFEIMSSLAEEVNTLINKFNGIVKHLLKKDAEGKKFLKSLMEDIEASRKGAGDIYG
jgi:hypothetical protein